MIPERIATANTGREQIRAMLNDQRLPTKTSLEFIHELLVSEGTIRREDSHWTFGKTLLNYLARSNIVKGKQIPFRGKRTQLGFDADDLFVFKASWSFLLRGGLLRSGSVSKYHYLLEHLSSEGLYPRVETEEQ